MKNHADGESPEISERLRFFVCGVLTLSFGGLPLSISGGVSSREAIHSGVWLRSSRKSLRVGDLLSIFLYLQFNMYVQRYLIVALKTAQFFFRSYDPLLQYIASTQRSL